jgi:hypothetical protein
MNSSAVGGAFITDQSPELVFDCVDDAVERAEAGVMHAKSAVRFQTRSIGLRSRP